MAEIDDILAKSGQQCKYSGVHLSNGCGHTERLNFTKGATLPNCSICNKQVHWIPKYPDGLGPSESKSFLS
jgi:hypothetical protein